MGVLHILGDKMELGEFFKSECVSLSKEICCGASVSFTDLNNGRNKTKKNGTAASFLFNGFKTEIMFIENGPFAFQPCTLWLTVVFEREPSLPFSVYDILAEADKNDFKCYTYTNVLTDELMKESFLKIGDLYRGLLPQIKEIVNNGVIINKLIEGQKKSICNYYGDDIYKESENIGGAVEKVRMMMTDRFFSNELCKAVVGAQADFYRGKPEKAYKSLVKSKYRSAYENALLDFLGTEESKSYNVGALSKESVKKAKKTADKINNKNFFGMFAAALILLLPVGVASAAVYYIIGAALFKDAVSVIGFDVFGAVMSGIFSFPLCIAAGDVVYSKYMLHQKRKSGEAKKENTVKISSGGAIYKILLITTETLAIIGCFSMLMNAAAFYPDYFTYSEKIFSVKQERYEYVYTENVYLVSGYVMGEKYYDEPYYAVKMKNGDIVDLYDATAENTDKFEKDVLPLFDAAGIETKTAKTEEDIK